MGLIGHNRGPALEGGGGWRSHCWRVSREALLPTLPVEVVRLRVRRARDLGLPYKTYAGIRAQTGHDIVAFLFSSNALRVTPLHPFLPRDRAEKLAALQQVGRMGMAVAPLEVSVLEAAPELDAAFAAPHVLAGFRETAQRLRAALGKLSADRVVLVGEGALEREWCPVGRLAGWIPAETYFT